MGAGIYLGSHKELTLYLVTERARKLRAQYVLQAQGLRTRMEIRIHRIPAGLRKVTMGELYEKQMEKAEPAQQKGKAAAIAAHQTLDPTEYISPNKTRPSPSKTIKTIAPEVRPQRKRTRYAYHKSTTAILPH